MPLRVHVFQHVHYEGLGSMETFFKDIGADITYTEFFAGGKAPAPHAFDLLLVMGGPMGVYDEAEFPWIKEEKQALKAALNAQKPVIGICLGSQLMAEVLGGKVTKNAHREIGWFPVERISNPRVSWVSECFPERFTTFHWHGDTFSIPSGASALFKSEGCANQGFVWGEKVVGLQFHPEITPAVAATWVETGASEMQPGPYVQAADQIMGNPEVFETNNGWIAALCRRLIQFIPSQN